jgi:D-glycero-D-manno-heptose 1,7-bisphosphate phosphatase
MSGASARGDAAPPRGRSRRPAAFLDRDGTIIRDVNHLVDPREIRLLPGAAAAIRRLNAAGLPVVIATNQSVVARGMTDEPGVVAINDEVVRRLARRGALVAFVEYCPHHPEGKVSRYRRRCHCRKPAPGMLLRAAEALSLDLSRSVVIGDSLADVEAGSAVGAITILLRRARGPSLRGRFHESGARADYSTTTLAKAVDWWLTNRRRLRPRRK